MIGSLRRLPVDGLLRTRRILLTVVVTLAFFSASDDSYGQTAIDFDSVIRPLLASRCLGCHGGDQPQADLDLTKPSESTLELIAPGEPHASELLARIKADDDARMPPEGSPLSVSEIAALEAWISEGASWPVHWSFRPLAQSPSPQLDREELHQWSRNLIDASIASDWELRGLSPVPSALRYKLLRRLSFDLHGLPPDPEEVARFETDSRPDAWERVVDRMLASVSFGERQARHWMDQVHFAETHGHDQDRPRDHAWPYRDYLIDRFNRDVPYSQFVQEQIAGDAAETGDPWSIVGTGFLAAGPWDESSLRDIREDAPDREVARYLDRDDIVTTVMTTFAGVSIQCARCHDHKFDPITQDDYYGLQAVFASTDKANRAVDLDPRLAEQRAMLETRLSEWRAYDPSQESMPEPVDVPALEQQLTALRALVSAWQTPPPTTVVSLAGATVEIQADHSALVTGARPDKDTTRFILPLARSNMTALRLEVLSDPSLPFSGPGRCDNGNLHVTEWQAFWRPSPNDRWIELEFAECRADFDQTGWTAAHAMDGNPTTAWGIYPEVGRDHQLVGILKEPLKVDGVGGELRIDILQAHGGSHLIGRARISVSEMAEPTVSLDAMPPADLVAQWNNEPLSLESNVHRRLIQWLRVRDLERHVAALPPQQMLYCGTNRFAAEGSFRPATTPHVVQVLRRGLNTDPIREAEPGAIEFLETLVNYPLPTDAIGDEQSRRVALARWLTDDRQPLTWRVMANRLWLQHFASGIVTTPNDFGQMGAAPSHPELLDRLAIELRDSDSLKWLHRRLVTSATYRLSAAHDSQAATIDAAAVYRWRMPLRRLDAESVRDGLLQISGALDSRMGGPSVKQFVQTPGIHVTPVVDYSSIALEDASFRRRSVYRFIFRTIPDPFYDSLDCPDASQWTPQRNVSLTAVQALATLHDRQIALAAERLSQRLAHECSDDSQRVERVFRLLFSRGATSEEHEMVLEFSRQQGWSATCLFLINANEFMFVD